MLPGVHGFSDELRASLALVNLRVKMGLSPEASAAEVVEAALERLDDGADHLAWAQASRERMGAWDLVRAAAGRKTV